MTLSRTAKIATALSALVLYAAAPSTTATAGFLTGNGVTYAGPNALKKFCIRNHGKFWIKKRTYGCTDPRKWRKIRCTVGANCQVHALGGKRPRPTSNFAADDGINDGPSRGGRGNRT